MKLIFITLIVVFTITSCGIRGYENFAKINSETSIVGKYRITDSSVYANPNFMLNLKDSVDRSTSFGAILYIDSVDNKFIHGRFERDGLIEPFISKRGLSKKYLTLKRKHHFKIYVLLNFYGTNKSRLMLSNEGDLLITKSNYGCGFIVIAPGFAASEEFDFVYKKE